VIGTRRFRGRRPRVTGFLKKEGEGEGGNLQGKMIRHLGEKRQREAYYQLGQKTGKVEDNSL